MRMAADSDGSLTAVVICEGNLHDPEFPRKFRHLLTKLKYILQQPKTSKKLKVNKVEPWNSVRVTLSIPKDAAAKLRQLASEGSTALRALGILSVQLEGDTVISLRLVGHDLVLRTDNTTTGCVQEAGSSNTSLSDLSQILGSRLQQTTAGPSSCSSNQTLPHTASSSISESVVGPSNRNLIPQPSVVPVEVSGAMNGGASGSGVSQTHSVMINGPTTSSFEKPPLFKSPNTVCPMDGKLPVPPLTNIAETREYPFESMTQARVIQRRENTMAVVAALGAAAQPNVAIANAPLSMSQGRQITPPPLAIPVAGGPTDTLAPQPAQGIVKSSFMQPPPPPYPIASGTNTLKNASCSGQHALQQQATNTISLSNGTNALSSPLLVNLLQNDGVNQMKAPAVASSVLLQQQQISPSALMVSNLTSHAQNDGVLLLNNSNNNNDSGSNISISPSIPVPSSSQTISNISNNAAPVPPVAAAAGTTATAGSILNQNVLGSSHQSVAVAGVGIRVQQQRFTIPPVVQQQQAGVQQPNLLPQHQIIQGPSGVQMARFPTQQHHILGAVGVMGGVAQPSFRHPQQQSQSQQVGMQQPYVAPSQSPHPSLVNHPQQQLAQQPTSNNFNHARWPFKPMDSATKSSFQEFARYQLQYNLQQEMNSQTSSVSAIGAAATTESGNIEAINSMGNVASSSGDKSSNVSDALGYLDELSKTDLDSLLLPGLVDLDSTLDLDGKNALESLLDGKDLVLDLIDQDGGTAALPDSMATCSVNSTNVELQPPTSLVPPNTISTPHSQQIQLPPPGQTEKFRSTPVNAVLNQESSELTSSGKKRQYLINAFTGELEAMPSEDESESEEPSNDNTDVFNELNSEVSNSLYSDDENSCSTAFSKASDHSDTERSSNSEASGRSRYSKARKERRDGSSGSSSHSSKKNKPSTKNNLLRDKFQQGIKDKMSGKSRQSKEKIMTKAKLIPIDGKDSSSEKIKLRLKLEKSEPVSTAYKVDISFVPSPKRAQSAMNTAMISLPNHSSSQSPSLSAAGYSNTSINQHQQNSLQTSASHNSSNQSPHSEEPRVPPLHISLRGKNSIVIKNSKKDRKKSQSGGEEDESYLKKVQLKRNNNSFDEQSSTNRYNVTNDHVQFSSSMNIKGSGQGKPITRIPSNDDYPGSNNFSKSVLENGEDIEKGFLTSKRVAMETTTNPNGLICPETKRRRMSQSHEHQQQINDLIAGEKHVQESFNHLPNPIGSTNVGTLPAHTSLSKNQKVSNNNNSSSFINKLHKSSIKSGKPLVVVKHCKSPTTNSVKDPGKSPPMKGSIDHSVVLSQTNSQTPALLKPSISSSSTSSALITTCKPSSGNSSGSGNSIGNPTTKPQPEPGTGAIAQQKGANKYSNTVCPLPQGSTEAMSEEKFKQKLLEFQGTSDKEQLEKITATNYVVNTSCSNNSNSAKAHEQVVQLSETKSGTLPITLLERRAQNPVTHVDDIRKSITVNTSVRSAVNSNTNSVDSAGLSSSENDLKEQCAMQEQQLRPPNQNQNTGSLEVGPNLLNNGEGSNNVRNSPGSQAQGEDSGIESMDALSEKSPHQSASPPQGDTQPAHVAAKTVDIVHSKIEEKISLVTNPKEDQEDEITNIRDIEAALAKMEGLNEHFLTPCESAMHKLNGDHSMKEESLLENLTDEKLMLCATKLEQEDDLAAIMGGNSSGKSTPVLSPMADVKDECRDLNENQEISSKLSLETQLVDECCKKSLKPNIKHEDDTEISTRISAPYSPKEKKFEENVIETASSLNEIQVKVSENVKSESAAVKGEEETVNAGTQLHTLNSTSSPLSGDVISEANDKSLVDIKEILTPISIEIPAHPESEVPRVRTRASSKLESPLDAPKQSPQLDSPATTNNPKSNLKLCASAIDRLSPKVSAGKSGCPGGVVSTANKRKRQGSESSTQSCVSDDTPSRGSSINSSMAKRSRPNSSNSTAQSSHEGNTPAVSKSGNVGNAIHKKQTSSKARKTQDESSDSDEPLIEVAGKVRSCKSSAGRPPSSSEDRNDNKVLRNHRTSSLQIRGPAHSSSHSTSTVSSTSNHQSPGTKTNRGAVGLHPNSGTSTTSTNAVAVPNCSNSIANNTHCTRASGGTSLGVAASSTTVNINNNTTGASSVSQSSNHSTGSVQPSASHDDKIGTRRSVRASAAANKIIYSRSGGPQNHSNGNTDANKTSAVGSHKNASNAPSADSSEPRRKTRSAAGGEATDGRRRRGSRDISSNEEDDREDDEERVSYDSNNDDDDEDIESQISEIDIDDLFQSPSQSDSDAIIAGDQDEEDVSHFQRPFDSGGSYVMQQLNYACVSKVAKMPNINTQTDGEDDLEPVSISDYDASDEEPSPVMTSTDEDDSIGCNDNDQSLSEDVNAKGSPSNYNVTARDHDSSSSDRGKYPVCQSRLTIPLIIKR